MAEQQQYVVGALRRTVFGNREQSSEAKMTVYNAVIAPTLVYGCEAWVLKDRDKTRLQAAAMKVLRRVVGVTRMGCVRDEVIRERLKQEAVVAKVKRKREVWREKVIENEGSLVNKVMNRQLSCWQKTQREAQNKTEG